MIIENADLLAEDKPNSCELCFRKLPLAWHHIYGRGAGGGTRLDVRINLVAICQMSFDAKNPACHSTAKAHGPESKEWRQKCLEAVARREGCEPEDVAAVIEAVIRLPRSPSENDFHEAWHPLTYMQAELFYEITKWPDNWHPAKVAEHTPEERE